MARGGGAGGVVRGRLEGRGPWRRVGWRRPLGCGGGRESRSALVALEAEGSPCAGASRREPTDEEWCERRLLARIHRYTVKRLRRRSSRSRRATSCASCSPGSTSSAMRAWRGLMRSTAVVAQLEGFDAPAGAWETEILRRGLAGYEPAWLDDRCLAGRVAWTRLGPRNGRTNGGEGAAPVRTTPITLVTRRMSRVWTLAQRRCGRGAAQPARAAGRRLTAQHGASFFDEHVGRQRAAALPARGSAGRAGRARPRDVRQLRRPARPAGAVRSAPVLEWRAPPTPDRPVRHGGRRPLGVRAPSRANTAAPAGDVASPGASGAHAASPLRRRVPAPARARGRLAAALARPAARLSHAGAARRDPRRPLRRRLLGRAVRLARGRSAPCARRGASRPRTRWSRSRARTRSTSRAS